MLPLVFLAQNPPHHLMDVRLCCLRDFLLLRMLLSFCCASGLCAFICWTLKKYKTMLTEWFVANQRYEDARLLTYLDFPSKWIWDGPNKRWKIRSLRKKKFGPPIGWIYNVHPTTNELFFLRMLLNVVQG
jgi:hypothetical protein